jgi:large subunit ribosomal protein L15
MIQSFLSNLPKLVERAKKRVGRGLGSGKGAKSGRGTTRHQKARESIPIFFEGGQGKIIKKFPLLRGKGRNKPKKSKKQKKKEFYQKKLNKKKYEGNKK